jgi:FMN-dependent NADH-azoreductase
MHLLNVQSSPRGPRSASIAVADAFLRAYGQACPELTVDTLRPLIDIPRALLIYARGGAYAEDSPTPGSRFDHQSGYFDFWLNFIGIKDVRRLVVESTSWGGKEKAAETIARGKAEAAKMAASF